MDLSLISHGHEWQGRLNSFPIQEDGHLLTVLRYVLRNPVRAGLVEQATHWPWSSLRVPHLTDAATIPLSEDGTHRKDQPLFEQELSHSAPV